MKNLLIKNEKITGSYQRTSGELKEKVHSKNHQEASKNSQGQKYYL